MPKKNQTISDALAQLIRESDLSCYAISNKSGVSEATLSRFLSGKAAVTTRTLDALQPILGLELRKKSGRK